MLVVIDMRGSVVSVLDTDDGAIDSVMTDELFSLIRDTGIEVKGVSSNTITPVKFGSNSAVLDNKFGKPVIDIRKSVSLHKWFITSVVAHVYDDGTSTQSSLFRPDNQIFKYIRFVVNIRNLSTKSTITVELRSLKDVELLINSYNPYGIAKDINEPGKYSLFEVSRACFEFLNVLDKVSIEVIDKSHSAFACLQKQKLGYEIDSYDGTLLWEVKGSQRSTIVQLFHLTCKLMSSCFVNGSLYIRVARKFRNQKDKDSPTYIEHKALLDDNIVAYKVDFTDPGVVERLVGKAIVTRMHAPTEYEHNW